MDTQPNPISFRQRLLLSLGVGVVLAACFPPIGLALLLPLCLAALLFLLRGATVRQAFYLGLTCGMAWFCGDLFWFTNLFGMASLSLCAILAVFPAVFAALFVWLHTRLPRCPLWLLAPLLWTGIEFYRSEPFVLNFGWLGLGYGVINVPLLAACASWFGSYGLTFGIVALGALLSTVVPGTGQPGREQPQSGTEVPVCEASPTVRRTGVTEGNHGPAEDNHRALPLRARAFLAVLRPEQTIPSGPPQDASLSSRKRLLRAGVLYGFWLLFLIPLAASQPVRPLHVRLVQANSEDEESFYALSRPAPGSAGEIADIIVWPEYSFVRDPTRTPKLWPKLVGIARSNHAYLLFGAKDQFDPQDEAGYRNTAYLLDPNGRLVGRHVKNHPVHFVRDGVAGTDARAIPTALGKLGVAICYDMDYPDVARRLTADGAEVLLVPNDDPPEWGPIQRAQHRLLFQMRAAECGRWLARADVAGGTSVAAPTGQEVARVHTTQPTRLEVSIGRETGRTLYVRGGWRFGQFCLLASIALWAGALLRRRPQGVDAHKT